MYRLIGRVRFLIYSFGIIQLVEKRKKENNILASYDPNLYRFRDKARDIGRKRLKMGQIH